MASEVSICNLALQKLGVGRQGRIVSLSQDSANARAMNNCYVMVRDAELRKRAWNFARKLDQLAASTTSPAFGLSYAYALPSDFIRLVPPNDRALDWRIRGRYIHTDYSAPLEIEYIYRVTDPNQMDALFQEALACKLAWQACEEVTQSNTKKADVMNEYKQAIADARQVNAFENISDEPPEDDWVAVRR